MSGDIGNAYERLRRLLLKIKYHGPIDQAMAMAGAPEFLLPLLHYVFLGYSRDIAKFVSNAGYELMGRSDMQFVSDCFRMLSDLFGYNPSISSKQFLARGFAERKLHMMSDVILLLMEKKKRLAPTQHSSRRSSIPTASVIRTVMNSSDQESSPSPRLSAPPVPTAKVPLKPPETLSSTAIAALSEQLASLEATVRSLNDNLSARITIIEGKVRYLEQKLKSQEPIDREEQERAREDENSQSYYSDKQAQPHRDRIESKETNSDCSERKLAPISSYTSHEDSDSNSSVPVTFSDRMNTSSSGDFLRNAFSVLSQTTDSAFVQNLLSRVEQTDLLLSSQFRPADTLNNTSNNNSSRPSGHSSSLN